MRQRTLWRKAERRYTTIRQQRIWGASDMQCHGVEMPRLRLRERRRRGVRFRVCRGTFRFKFRSLVEDYPTIMKKCHFKLQSEGTISR